MLKMLAALKKRPIAEFIREAMAAFLKRERRSGRSVLEIPAHQSGSMLRGWTRSDLYDEMLGGGDVDVSKVRRPKAGTGRAVNP